MAGEKMYRVGLPISYKVLKMKFLKSTRLHGWCLSYLLLRQAFTTHIENTPKSWELRPVGSPALKPWKQQNRKGNGHIDIATIVLVPELKSSKNYFGGLWGDGSLQNTSVVISNNTFNISIPKYNRIHVLAASKRYFIVPWGHSGLKMTTEQSHRGNRWSKIWTQRPQLPMFPCFSGL